MSEFTKEQLQEIYRCIEHMSNDFNLVDKVESMIENYDAPETLRDIRERTKRHGGC
jgi:hypothetical protein